jgi:restriction system protein
VTTMHYEFNLVSALMVRHNIGVQDQQTYVIKRVDEDFFDES